MNARAYVVLFALVLLGAFAVMALGRRPQAQTAAHVTAHAAPLAVTRIAVSTGAVTPQRSLVRLGSRVELHARNTDACAHHLTLAGYDDRVSALAIAARDSTTATFIADRPGDDFAWLVDGEPAGVFSVAGSHLVEGHR